MTILSRGNLKLFVIVKGVYILLSGCTVNNITIKEIPLPNLTTSWSLAKKKKKKKKYNNGFFFYKKN